jgi:predicted ATPase/DNA-binding XRE family transcriptional regulator
MPAKPPATFGDLLRAHRRAVGLTQQQLAERAGLSVHGIQKLERGATHPYRDTAQRLMVALQLDADQRTLFQAAVMPVHRRGMMPPDDNTDAARHNLPVPLSNTVGREAAIVEVTRRLVDTRLLTLTGIGGCGKTRLAIEVARTAIDAYSAGVWFVELGPLVDPSLVVARVAGVLGVRETAEQPVTTTLANALRARHTLLVLDNCEHLLDACAQLVDGLLRVCPGLRVLATSREPIGIEGEVTWRVPSLALPAADSRAAPEQLLLSPAVDLFVQRATAAQPRFALSARNASAVVQICRRLDGIPLALELAAARMQSLTAEQVAVRLDARFRLLTGGSRAALPRQQTLAATLDWSYDLLSRPERSLFERLAVFSGGWTLEAAEDVCADGALQREAVLDVLANLTRKSLVIAEETTYDAERYSMLETVRDYARQKLASRTAAQIRSLRDRHADFFGRWIRHLLPDIFGRSLAEGAPREIDPFLLLDADYDNLLAALAWLLESGQAATGIRLTDRLWRYWVQRGLDGEARRWLVTLGELADRTSPDRDGRSPAAADTEALTLAERAKLATGLASVTLRHGDYVEARAYAEEGIAIWRELGDDWQATRWRIVWTGSGRSRTPRAGRGTRRCYSAPQRRNGRQVAQSATRPNAPPMRRRWRAREDTCLQTTLRRPGPKVMR